MSAPDGSEREAVARALGLLLAIHDDMPEVNSGDFVWLMLGDTPQERYDTILAMGEIAIGLLMGVSDEDPRALFTDLAEKNAEQGL